jgi:hypothetical protein
MFLVLTRLLVSWYHCPQLVVLRIWYRLGGQKMDIEGPNDKVVPPYVPYRTLRNFVDGFRQAIPQRIDPSLMRSIGGTIRRQLMYALRYLQLIDENGIPQEVLIKWVRAEGPERQQILRGILQEGYPFLLGNTADGFDLATATSRQFAEKFQQFSIQRDTLRKASAFFLHAAADAGITISSYIKKPARQQSEARRATRPRNGQRPNRHNSGDAPPQPRPIETNPKTNQERDHQPLTSRDTLIHTFVMKMPDFNPEWEPEVQNRWFEMLKRLTAMTEATETERDKEGAKGEG